MDFLRSPQEATSEESVIVFFCFWLPASPFKKVTFRSGCIPAKWAMQTRAGNVQLTTFLVIDLVLNYGDLKRKTGKTTPSYLTLVSDKTEGE